MAFQASYKGHPLKRNSTFMHPEHGKIKFKGVVNLTRVNIEKNGSTVSVKASDYSINILNH